MTGEETLDFLHRHQVDRAVIGATALSVEGVLETVPGFAAVKRAMLARAAQGMLLIHGKKFGARGFARAARLDELASVVVDRAPPTELGEALAAEGVEVQIAT